MYEIKFFEASGLYAEDDMRMVYEPRTDVMGNPVMDNSVKPKFDGIPTGPEAIVSDPKKSKYPNVTGNEMFSNTDFPLPI